ncbi:MAG: helix-turn-helix domain-containing protein [Ardenticatenaceae bacterium]|nr:helix-turn-helix domain-containing protein [Ardenticatenaceae bacterium]
MEPDWINLSEAAELLGVHPATVRAWGDKGELPMQRTPGGHRRFRRADVEARAIPPDRSQTSGVQLVVQNMVGRARLELTEGALNDETWYQRLDEPARQQLRQIGHQLLHLFIQFLTQETERQTIRAEAQTIGRDYERLGRENGLSLAETTQAYLYFREFLSQTVYDMAETMGTQGPIHWGQIHNKIITITNDVLLALIAAHEEKQYEF